MVFLGSTEDAAARSVITFRKPKGITWWTTLTIVETALTTPVSALEPHEELVEAHRDGARERDADPGDAEEPPHPGPPRTTCPLERRVDPAGRATGEEERGDPRACGDRPDPADARAGRWCGAGPGGAAPR